MHGWEWIHEDWLATLWVPCQSTTQEAAILSEGYWVAFSPQGEVVGRGSPQTNPITGKSNSTPIGTLATVLRSAGWDI